MDFVSINKENGSSGFRLVSLESLRKIYQLKMKPTMTAEIMEDIRNTGEDPSNIDELGNSKDGSVMGFHRVRHLGCSLVSGTISPPHLKLWPQPSHVGEV